MDKEVRKSSHWEGAVLLVTISELNINDSFSHTITSQHEKTIADSFCLNNYAPYAVNANRDQIIKF